VLRWWVEPTESSCEYCLEMSMKNLSYYVLGTLGSKERQSVSAPFWMIQCGLLPNKYVNQP
jgi:hypothetical protein